MNSDFTHISVLKTTVLDVLKPINGETVLDVTLGLGGHAHAMLEATSPDGRLVGLDADNENLEVATRNLSAFEERVTLYHCNFGDIDMLHLEPVDIILADLGLSSAHLDDAARGFSFRLEGPLDLRFDRTRGMTAAQMVEDREAAELAEIFRSYGELYKEATKLSRAIAGTQIPTTTALKEIVEKEFGFRARFIMAQVFQALRIAVNEEMQVLERLLTAIPRLLRPGGRAGIISFHSLEDRMVKHSFKALATPEKDPITGKISVPAAFEILTSKPLIPSDDEIAHNPRARSAKFRAIRRIPS